jgi:hypothetical protein
MISHDIYDDRVRILLPELFCPPQSEHDAFVDAVGPEIAAKVMELTIAHDSEGSSAFEASRRIKVETYNRKQRANRGSVSGL